MEVITLLLLMGAGLVECQTKPTEVDQANQKTVFIVDFEVLLVGVILLLVLNLIEARKRKYEPAKRKNCEVEMANKRVLPVKCQGGEVDKTQGESLTIRLASLTHSLRNMPQNMRSFSQSIRALYAEKAPGTTSETATNLNRIRNDTRRDALVYVKEILPVSITVVRSIKELFDQYESIDFNEWIEYLPSMLEEVRDYRQCCETLVTLHQNIMVPLKKRQDVARVLISELEDLTEELETKKSELEDSAKDHKVSDMQFSSFPRNSIFATRSMEFITARHIVEAVAGAQQSKINKSVITLLSETMMPAVSSFVDGLNAAAGFFKVVEDDIASFKATKMKIGLKQQLHYKIMKKQASEVKENCREFYCMIPEVKSDFKAIPEMPDDRNYVERWLQKQQEHTARTYSAKIKGQQQNLPGNCKTTTKGRPAIEEKKEM